MSSSHFTEGLHVRDVFITLSKEDARWLALLIDTEGAIGWTRFIHRRNRINEKYKYEYLYFTPYMSLTMDEFESKRTVETAAKLMGTIAFLRVRLGERATTASVHGGRVLEILTQLEPYFDKWKRMASFILTIFRPRPYPREEPFKTLITKLFGKYHTPGELNPILLKMTPNQYNQLLIQTQQQVAIIKS